MPRVNVVSRTLSTEVYKVRIFDNVSNKVKVETIELPYKVNERADSTVMKEMETKLRREHREQICRPVQVLGRTLKKYNYQLPVELFQRCAMLNDNGTLEPILDSVFPKE